MKIRVGKKSVDKRYGFRISGNINHVRYDHKRRPREIHVICPKCNKMAIAIDAESDSKYEFVVDMSPSWKGSPFEVTCTNCIYKENDLSYFDIPEPYHCIYVDGKKLWAYNWKHLDLISKVLSEQNVENHLYNFYTTFIHGEWKKNSIKFIEAIKKHVAENDKLHEFSSSYFQSK